MSAKHVKPAKPRRARIDRPFAPDVLKRANDIAAHYRIVLESDPDVGYLGNCLEMPLVMADGKTPDACVESTREAIVGVVAHLLEKGEVPPSPAREQRRDQQVNVRLTVEEKLALEEAARQHGFKGVSDYVRSRSLEPAR